ncbi:MAG: hypothetical protein VX278_12295 [Myxococcota bacterium]|nr:hypothetical protein [Myxococcota bacterium]
MFVYFPNVVALSKAIPLLGNIEADLRWIELERGALLELPNQYARKIMGSAYQVSDTHAVSKEERLKITSIKRADTLFSLLSHQRVSQVGTPKEVIMLFDEQKEAIPTIMSALYLDCSDITFAFVEVDQSRAISSWITNLFGSSAGRRFFMLRIQEPSWFFLEGRDEVYYPQRDGCWVPLGHTHPLVSLVPKNEEILFHTTADIQSISLSKIKWRNIFEILQPKLKWETESVFLSPKESLDKIPIPLRAIKKAHPSPSTMYLMENADIRALYQELQEMDESVLRDWLFLLQEDAQGNRYLLLKDKKGQTWPFQARSLSASLCLNNLLIPSDTSLVPRVLESTYRTVFQLNSGQIKVYLPDSKRVLSFAGRFDQLGNLIDYIMMDQVEALERLASLSAMRLREWAKLDVLHPVKNTLLKKKKLAVLKAPEVSKKKAVSGNGLQQKVERLVQKPHQVESWVDLRAHCTSVENRIQIEVAIALLSKDVSHLAKLKSPYQACFALTERSSQRKMKMARQKLPEEPTASGALSLWWLAWYHYCRITGDRRAYQRAQEKASLFLNRNPLSQNEFPDFLIEPLKEVVLGVERAEKSDASAFSSFLRTIDDNSRLSHLMRIVYALYCKEYQLEAKEMQDPSDSIRFLDSLEHSEKDQIQQELKRFLMEGLPSKSVIRESRVLKGMESLWMLKSNSPLNLDEQIVEKLVKALSVSAQRRDQIQGELEQYLQVGNFQKVVDTICGHIAYMKENPDAVRIPKSQRLAPAFCSIPYIKKIQPFDTKERILQETLQFLLHRSEGDKGYLDLYPLLFAGYVLILFEHPDGNKSIQVALDELSKTQYSIMYKKFFPAFQIVLPLLPLVDRFERLRTFAQIIIEDQQRTERPFEITLELAVQIVDALSSNKVRTILLLDKFIMRQEIFFRKEILKTLEPN